MASAISTSNDSYRVERDRAPLFRTVQHMLSAVLFSIASLSQATVYYVSDCQAGAAAGCVAGSDSNAGTSLAAPWQTTAKVAAVFSTLAAGDQLLFARGASFINANMRLVNFNSTGANPIVQSAVPLLVLAGPANNLNRRAIAETAIRYRLPALFQWTRRPATPSDSYQLSLFDPHGSAFGQTGLLGYVSGVNLTGLPGDFHAGTFPSDAAKSTWPKRCRALTNS